MSKLKMIVFLFITFALLTGCTSQQPTEEENEINAAKMLDYVSEKYELEFQQIEYIPGKRSYNDFMEENVLIAESEVGILVDVKEKLGDIGDYYDNYANFYASNMIDEEMDYSNVDNVVAAKSYAPVLPDDISYEELKTLDKVPRDAVIRFYCFIAVSELANDEVLMQLYDIYQQMEALDMKDKMVLVTAFSGNTEQAEKFVNNFFYYGTKAQDWESFDPTIEQILHVNEAGLDFAEFKERLYTVEG